MKSLLSNLLCLGIITQFLHCCTSSTDTLTQQEKIRLLQGPWKDSVKNILYIKKDSVFDFANGTYMHSRYEFKNDTFFLFDLTGFNNHAVIERITLDSLKLRTIETNKQFIYTRPDSLEIQKDTTVVVESDSLVETTTQKINGFDYSFEVFKRRPGSNTHYYLEIRLNDCEDSCLKLTEDLIFIYKSHNDDGDYKTVYEIQNDLIVFYSLDDYVEHMSDADPHPKTYYRKVIYKTDSRGNLVKLKSEEARKNSDLARQVEGKIEKLFKEL